MISKINEYSLYFIVFYTSLIELSNFHILVTTTKYFTVWRENLALFWDHFYKISIFKCRELFPNPSQKITFMPYISFMSINIKQISID